MEVAQVLRSTQDERGATAPATASAPTDSVVCAHNFLRRKGTKPILQVAVTLKIRNKLRHSRAHNTLQTQTFGQQQNTCNRINQYLTGLSPGMFPVQQRHSGRSVPAAILVPEFPERAESHFLILTYHIRTWYLNIPSCAFKEEIFIARQIFQPWQNCI